MSERIAVVVGFGVTGRAVQRHLSGRGWTVRVVDDRPSEQTMATAAAAGIDVTIAPDRDQLARVLRGATLVVPGPGVGPTHPVFELAREAGVDVRSEIEVGAACVSAPMVAVTGTNGKTTVTTMIAAMLNEAGLRAVAAGNIGLPLVDVVDERIDVVVVETSSFQLQHTERFHPAVSVWLNLAEDHLDWHPDMAHYAAAKARVWAKQGPGDTAVVNADDAEVMAQVAAARARVVTFSIADDVSDWRLVDGQIAGPAGPLVATSALPRALPHDLANALAAAAAASAAGADLAACSRVLRAFTGLPHRVELVGESGGVRFYDDSKATTPASVLAALRGFPSVVLIAGGRNKGLDLSILRAAADRVRSVVAIGEAAPDIAAVFSGVVPVESAPSMDAAVRAARSRAHPGDAVLLSPGCASYDWYSNYGERGDAFARAVHEQIGSAA